MNVWHQRHKNEKYREDDLNFIIWKFIEKQRISSERQDVVGLVLPRRGQSGRRYQCGQAYLSSDSGLTMDLQQCSHLALRT